VGRRVPTVVVDADEFQSRSSRCGSHRRSDEVTRPGESLDRTSAFAWTDALV
jgi:hypothetical protein